MNGTNPLAPTASVESFFFSPILCHRNSRVRLPSMEKVDVMFSNLDILAGKVAQLSERKNFLKQASNWEEPTFIKRVRDNNSSDLKQLPEKIKKVTDSDDENIRELTNLNAYLSAYIATLDACKNGPRVSPIWRYGIEHRMSEIIKQLKDWKPAVVDSKQEHTEHPIEKNKKEALFSSLEDIQESAIPSMIPPDLHPGLRVLRLLVRLKEMLTLLTVKTEFLGDEGLESDILDEQCAENYAACKEAYEEILKQQEEFSLPGIEIHEVAEEKKQWVTAKANLVDKITVRSQEVKVALERMKPQNEIQREQKDEIQREQKLDTLQKEEQELEECFYLLEIVVALKEEMAWIGSFEKLLDGKSRLGLYQFYEEESRKLTNMEKAFDARTTNLSLILGTRIKSHKEVMSLVNSMEARIQAICSENLLMAPVSLDRPSASSSGWWRLGLF